MNLEARLLAIFNAGYALVLKNHLMYVPGTGHIEGWTLSAYDRKNVRHSIFGGVFATIDKAVADTEARIADQSKEPSA